MNNENSGMQQTHLVYVVTRTVNSLHTNGEYYQTIELIKVFPALKLAQYYVNQTPQRDRLDYNIEEVEAEGF